MVDSKGDNKRAILYAALIVCVLCAASFVRVWRLGDLPAGFYIDEASFGYNAYSIHKTGADEFGNRFPLYTPSFGTGKNPVYLYATVVATWLFDLNEFSTRLPAAVFGILTVLFTIFLCEEITGRKYSGVIAGAFLALNPWHVFFSRFAVETTSMTCFISAGFLLLLKGLKKPRLLPVAALVLGVGFYTYAPAIPFIFIMLAGFAVIFRKEISRIPASIKTLSVALLIISCVPHAMYDAGGGEQVSHLKNSFITNPANDDGSRELLRKASWPGADATPVVMRSALFAKNYLSNYSPTYLFENGDLSSYRAHVRGFGPFLCFTALPLIAGLLAALFSKSPGMKFLLLWYVVFPIGAALSVQDYPSATRTFNALPCFQIFFAVGMIHIFEFIRNRLTKSALSTAIAGAFVLIFSISFMAEFAKFAIHYSVEYPKYSSIDWNYGFRDAINYSENSGSEYYQIVVSENIPFSYIYPLYYGKILPNSKSVDLKRKGPYRVGRIGKYDVRDPYLQYGNRKQLFITGSWERPDLREISILNKNGIPSIVKVSEFVPKKNETSN